MVQRCQPGASVRRIADQAHASHKARTSRVSRASAKSRRQISADRFGRKGQRPSAETLVAVAAVAAARRPVDACLLPRLPYSFDLRSVRVLWRWTFIPRYTTNRKHESSLGTGIDHG